MTTTRVDRRWAAPLPANRRGAVVAAAAAAVLARALTTTLANAPGGPAVGGGTLVGVSTAVAALAAVGAALTVDDPTVGVGLLFVGVFGVLSLASAAVALPAAVAVVAGTAAVALARRESLSPVPALAVGVLLVALTVGLASGVGGRVALRPAASTLALVGVAVTPVFAATTGRATLAGGLAGGVVLAVGLAHPFVTGAVTLVGGVVGTSLPVVAFAAGGAVTTASAATRNREWLLLGSVALLAFAGVPTALDRAVPFALGVAMLTLWEGER